MKAKVAYRSSLYFLFSHRRRRCCCRCAIQFLAEAILRVAFTFKWRLFFLASLRQNWKGKKETIGDTVRTQSAVSSKLSLRRFYASLPVSFYPFRVWFDISTLFYAINGGANKRDGSVGLCCLFRTTFLFLQRDLAIIIFCIPTHKKVYKKDDGGEERKKKEKLDPFCRARTSFTFSLKFCLSLLKKYIYCIYINMYTTFQK